MVLRKARITQWGYDMELNRYEAQNLPRWEAAQAGRGDMTLEELTRDFGQYRRLRQLTDYSARPAGFPSLAVIGPA